MNKNELAEIKEAVNSVLKPFSFSIWQTNKKTIRKFSKKKFAFNYIQDEIVLVVGRIR